MRVVFRVRGNPWWIRPIETVGPVAELSEEEKLRRLVNAALGTPYFSQRERAEQLLDARKLQDLPVVRARQLLDAKSQFLNPKAEKARGFLRLPFDTDSCAVMGKKLRLPKGAVAVEDGMLGRLHLSETRMLAATPSMLRRICASVEARAMALPRLCEAVVVLQGLEEGMLYEGERDMLWHCLGVPVYEQWLGLDGELLAWECGAHQGMHFHRNRAELEEVDGELVVTSWFGLRTPVPRIATGFMAAVDKRVCGCGDERPILRDLGLRCAGQDLRCEMATA
jgi:hypothetical protein